MHFTVESANLIDNTCYWIDTIDEKPRRVVIKLDQKYRTVVIADSGPGIHDMKGDIQPLTNPKFRIDDISGAQFLLDFGRVQESKDS